MDLPLTLEKANDTNTNPVQSFNVLDPSTWDPEDPFLFLHKHYYQKCTGEVPSGFIDATPAASQSITTGMQRLTTEQLKMEVENFTKPDWQVRCLEREGNTDELNADWYNEINEFLEEGDDIVNDPWIAWHVDFTHQFEQKMNALQQGERRLTPEETANERSEAVTAAAVEVLPRRIKRVAIRGKNETDLLRMTIFFLTDSDCISRLETAGSELLKELVSFQKSIRDKRKKKLDNQSLKMRAEINLKSKVLKRRIENLQNVLIRLEMSIREL